MQIKELRLVNFCGFEKFRVSFAPFTALIGANNGGKTTVLRAIHMVFDAIAMEVSTEKYFSLVFAWHKRLEEINRQTVDVSKYIEDKYQSHCHALRHPKGGLYLSQEMLTKNLDAALQEKNQKLIDQEEHHQNSLAQHQSQRPAWQCDINELIRRAHAENTERFHFKHNLQQDARVEMDIADACGVITISLVIGHARQAAAMFCQCDQQDLFSLTPEKCMAVHKALQDARCFFTYSVSNSNLSSSEQSLSWPQVQQQIMEGKEHEVWRNQLHWLVEGKSPEAYQRVIERIQQTLGAISVRSPSRTREQTPHEIVTYEENGIEFDLTEGGAGLGSLLDVAARIELAGASVLLFDEPDAHLYSSVQRQLAEFLEAQASPSRQIIVCTHAPDMIDQFALESLVWIDRDRAEGRACNELGRMMASLCALSHTDAMELSQADALLFFETEPDKKIFDLLARKCGLERLPDLAQIARLGSCGGAERLAGVVRIMQARNNQPVAMAVLRGATPDGAKAPAKSDAVVLVLNLPCRELDNLLLLQPGALLDAVAASARRDKESAGHRATPALGEIETWIDAITQSPEITEMAENNWLVALLQHHDADALAQAKKEYASSWADAMFRRKYAPGKEVLKRLRKKVQDEWQLALGNPFEYYKPDDEIKGLFKKVQEHFDKLAKPDAKNPAG